MKQEKLHDFRFYVPDEVEKKWKKLARQQFGKVDKITLEKTLSKGLDLIEDKPKQK